MKISALMGLFAIGALAAPHDLVKRAGITDNDIKNGKCEKYTFIMARGSTEPGNMGISVGPPTCSQLKRKLGSVACQGVGGAYNAGIATNVIPGGTDAGAIRESENMFNMAAEKCPDTIMLGAGYSQGAAVMTRSVGKLDENVKSRVAGVVLYGDTQNKQTGGSIPNYPKDDVMVICAATDGVCGGALLVTPGHLTYVDDVPKAVSFLAGKAKSNGGGSSSSSSSSSGDDSSSSSSSGGLGGLGSFGGLGSLGGGSSSSGSDSGSSDSSSSDSSSSDSGSSSGSGLGGLGGLSGFSSMFGK